MKFATLALFSTAAGALLLVSCDQRTQAPTAAAPSSSTPTTSDTTTAATGAAQISTDWAPDPKATLTASPNPVPVGGSGPGTTTLTWSTGRPTASLYVSANGAAETLFAEGAQSSSDAPWITSGSTYDFRLYTGRDRKTLLSRVTVTGAK